MKALAIIIQTKRGENAFVVTANNFSQQMAQEYSHLIYNIIINNFKKSQRVDRTFLFRREISAVCNIARDMIIQVLVTNGETQFGVECLKKANELLTKHAKNETTLKKYIEIFSCLEEMLYSRDYSLTKLHLSLKPSEIVSAKKSIDLDIFTKFPLLNNDGEKTLIQTVPLKYSKRAFTSNREANLRYQVVKTYQLPINKDLKKDTQLKKFYRHNLASQAFNKNQTKPNLMRQSTRPSAAPKMSMSTSLQPKKISMGSLSNLDGSPNQDLNDTMMIAASHSNLPSHRVSQYNPEPEPEREREREIIVTKPVQGNDNYDPMEIFAKAGNQQQQQPQRRKSSDNYGFEVVGDDKHARNAYEDRREVNNNSNYVDNSFNSFSHDMFNTVSLPANLNLQRDSSTSASNNNRSSVASSNGRSSVTDSMYNSQLSQMSANQNTNQMNNNMSDSQTYYNNRQSYASNDFQNIAKPSTPVNNNSSDPWDLLSQIQFPSNNPTTNTQINPPQVSQPQYQTQSHANTIDLLNFDEPVYQQPVQPKVKPEIKVLKIMEKFYITIKNSKVQNLLVAGQVAVDIDDKGAGSLPNLNMLLSPPNLWEDETKINKRFNNKEMILGSRNAFYQLQLGKPQASIPLFDYRVSSKFVDPNKIPLFFMYKVESPGEGKCNFLLQYKINGKLGQSFNDVDITVNFKSPLSGFAVKTVPNANNLSDKSISWKAKSLGPDSQGKIGILLENCYDTSGKILEDIKVTLKGQSILHNTMNAYASFNPNASPEQFADTNIFSVGQKRQIIEYKVLANEP